MQKRRIAAPVIAAIAPVVLLIIIGGSAYPQQPKDKNSAATGAGTLTCAIFGEAYKQSPTYVETTDFFWAQGLMSGINMMILAHKQTTTNLAVWDTEHQMQHIRFYCANHPLADYFQAVLDLFDSMRHEQQLPDWRR